MNRRLPRLLIVLLGLSLALVGCSKIGLVYNRLPTLAGFELGRYVDLSKPQKQIFDEQFDRVWRWHRTTQLPLYATDLRQIARLAQAPLTPTQLDETMRRMQQHVEVAGHEIVGAMTPLLASLDDAQVAGLFKEFDRDAEKERRKRLKRNDKEWAEERYEKAIDNLDEWTDEVTPVQRERIRQWANGLKRDPPDSHDADRTEFAALMNERKKPDFEQTLQTALAFDPEGTVDSPEAARRKARLEANRALLIDLSQSATDAQRAFLRKKLEAMADELDGLSKPIP